MAVFKLKQKLTNRNRKSKCYVQEFSQGCGCAQSKQLNFENSICLNKYQYVFRRKARLFLQAGNLVWIIGGLRH